jgi:folate-binding protein YgfZ
MNAMTLRTLHQNWGAHFTEINGQEGVDHYGRPDAEYAALCHGIGLLDLSFRGRLCLTGADRRRFLNGQVTNNVKDLQPGQGCYAALVNAKGKVESDLNVYGLDEEYLLDFEPGLSERITRRFETFIIADDVTITDVAPLYGLLSLQGPRSAEALAHLAPELTPPDHALAFTRLQHPAWGEIYCMNQARGASLGYDLFLPHASLETALRQIEAVLRDRAGRPCGWRALETLRIEAGLPRYGQDMDATNLAPEAGLESRAISYTKGCYIGQEVIARIRTYGQVAKTLRGLRLAGDLPELPPRGTPLLWNGREVGYLTSAVASPRFRANLALGYVRREHNQAGTRLMLRTSGGESQAEIVPLPFTDHLDPASNSD